MKPAPFDYVRPASLAEACEILAGDDDARAIAGGQTLVPMLAMRLARPARLIDILRLPELAGIREENGAIVVGAATRQAQAERDPVIRASVPMLARVLPWVGHPPTRNRGTVGGSIANGDPSAEIPLVAVTLGAGIVLASEGWRDPRCQREEFLSADGDVDRAGASGARIRFRLGHKRIRHGLFRGHARARTCAFVSAPRRRIALDGGGALSRHRRSGLGGVADDRCGSTCRPLVRTNLDEAPSLLQKTKTREKKGKEKGEKKKEEGIFGPPGPFQIEAPLGSDREREKNRKQKMVSPRTKAPARAQTGRFGDGGQGRARWSRQRPSSSSAICAAAEDERKSARRALTLEIAVPCVLCRQTGNRIARTHWPCSIDVHHRPDENSPLASRRAILRRQHESRRQASPGPAGFQPTDALAIDPPTVAAVSGRRSRPKAARAPASALTRG